MNRAVESIVGVIGFCMIAAGLAMASVAILLLLTFVTHLLSMFA